MKSERQAARIADFCASVGGAAGAAEAAAGAAAGAGSRTAVDFLLGAVAAGFLSGACAVGGAEPWTAAWHAGDRSAAFDCRHSRSSGLSGLIHEQCVMKSLSVQDCRTALS